MTISPIAKILPATYFSRISEVSNLTCSLTTSMPIPTRTSFIKRLPSSSVKELGRPFLKELKSPRLAASRILVPDMPEAESASGSRSPADTTSMVSKLKTLPLYLSRSFLYSGTRSEPATITRFLYLPDNIFAASMKVRISALAAAKLVLGNIRFR